MSDQELRRTLRIDPVLDQDAFAAQLDEIEQQASARRVQFGADFAGANRELTAFSRRAQTVGRQGIRLNVDVLGDEQVDEIVDLVDRLDGRVAAIDVNTDRAEVDETFRLLAQLDAFRATIDVDVQDQRLQDALADVDRLGERVTSVLTIQERGRTVDDIRSDLARLEAGVTVPVEVEQQGGTDFDFSDVRGSVQNAINAGIRAVGPGGAAVAGLAATVGLAVREGIGRQVDEDLVAAQFLLSEEEARRVGEAGGNAYVDGFFIESRLQAEQQAATLQRTLAGITDVTTAELESLTEQSLALTTVQGQDAQLLMRALAGTLSNELAPSAQAAFDAFTFGLANTDQRGDDLLETFAEYSNQLDAAGVSAEQFVSLAVVGLEEGARRTDGIADAVKELTLGITENNIEIRETVEDLGLSYTDVLDLINSGQGFEAIQQISAAVDGLNARSEQQRVLQILLRGTYEQVGVDAFTAFSRAADGIDEIDGSSQRALDTLNSNAQAGLAGVRREIETAFEDVGDSLIQSIQGTASAGDVQDSARALGEALGAGIVAGVTAVLRSPSGIEAAVEGTVEGIASELVGEGDNFFQRFLRDLGDEVQSGGILGDFGVGADPVLDGIELDLGEVGFSLSEAGLADQGEILDGLTDAFAGADAGSLGLAGSIDELGDAAGAAADETADLSETVVSLDDALNRLFNFSADQVLADTAEAAAELVDQLAEIGDVDVGGNGAFDVTSEGGAELLDVLAGVNSLYQDNIRLLQERLITGDEFAQRQQILTDALREGGEAAGFEAGEVQDLIDRFLSITDLDPQAVQNLGLSLDPEGLIPQGSEIQDALAAAIEANDLEARIPLAVDADALTDLNEIGGAIAGTDFQATASIDTSAADRNILATVARGEEWAGTTYSSMLDADQDEVDRVFDAVVGRGDEWAGAIFRSVLDMDGDLVDAEFDDANQQGAEWANTLFEATVDLDTRAAERELDRLTRARTVQVNATVGGTGQGLVNINGTLIGANGLIVGANGQGIARMANSGIIDGIAPATPGGYYSVMNGTLVNYAENGHAELLLNAGSTLERKMSLLDQFGGLGDQLRQAYAAESGGGGSQVTINAALPPIADPDLAMRELGSQILHRVDAHARASQRRARRQSWRPR